MDLPKLGTFWMGRKLSYLEHLCLTSLVRQGHSVTLFSYEPVEVPKGVNNEDGSAIFPAHPQLCHASNGSPAIHSDFFRYNMLNIWGGIWVDADVFAQRSLLFETREVFGWERKTNFSGSIAMGVLALSKESPVLEALIALGRSSDRLAEFLSLRKKVELILRNRSVRVPITAQPWGTTGPKALTYYVRKFSQEHLALSTEAFYPLPFSRATDLISPLKSYQDLVKPDSYCIHLWASHITQQIKEHHGGLPPAGSPLADMLQQAEIDPKDFPLS